MEIVENRDDTVLRSKLLVAVNLGIEKVNLLGHTLLLLYTFFHFTLVGEIYQAHSLTMQIPYLGRSSRRMLVE
jgi:hypothetical protein